MTKLTRPKYVVYTNGEISAVFCKGCGTKIRGLVPSEQHESTEKRGNRIIVRERLILACLPSYTEVTLEVEDANGRKAKHVTPLCTNCADLLDSDGELASDIYDCDIDQLAAEAGVGRGPELKKRYKKFRPKKVLEKRAQ